MLPPVLGRRSGFAFEFLLFFIGEHQGLAVKKRQKTQ